MNVFVPPDVIEIGGETWFRCEDETPCSYSNVQGERIVRIANDAWEICFHQWQLYDLVMLRKRLEELVAKWRKRSGVLPSRYEVGVADGLEISADELRDILNGWEKKE